MHWYIGFLPGWFGAEINCTVRVLLPKQPINQFKLNQKSKQQLTVLIYIYCAQDSVYSIWPTNTHSNNPCQTSSLVTEYSYLYYSIFLTREKGDDGDDHQHDPLRLSSIFVFDNTCIYVHKEVPSKAIQIVAMGLLIVVSNIGMCFEISE